MPCDTLAQRVTTTTCFFISSHAASDVLPHNRFVRYSMSQDINVKIILVRTVEVHEIYRSAHFL